MFDFDQYGYVSGILFFVAVIMALLFFPLIILAGWLLPIVFPTITFEDILIWYVIPYFSLNILASIIGFVTSQIKESREKKRLKKVFIGIISTLSFIFIFILFFSAPFILLFVILVLIKYWFLVLFSLIILILILKYYNKLRNRR